MHEKIDCDLAIIGAGAGGLSVAAGVSQLGLKVVLIEQGPMGGDCLNAGCVPSKSLLAAAKRYWQAHHAQQMGTIIEKSSLDFPAVMKHVHHVIETIAVNDSVERFEQLGVRVIKASGQFVDDKNILAGNYTVHANHFVIATGSSPAIPSIPGIERVDYLTNESIFNLEELPEHLIVIGGGPIGCELAQAFAMLGARVTLLEGLGILGQDEPECVQQIRDALQVTGVDLLEGVQVNELSTTHDSIVVHARKNGQPLQFQGSHLLIATGRTANIASLACEKAGVRFNKKGIMVDRRLRTSNSKIYAIGDATGLFPFTHVANYHAGIVMRNIVFKLPAKIDSSVIPWVTYTEPELAHVGKTEQQCKLLSIRYTTLKIAYTDNDRAQTENETQGLIKVLTNKKGQILGASIVGHLAGELILPWVIAIREGKTLRAFTDTIIAYPTFGELHKRIASQFYAPKLFSNKVKMLVKFLSWF